MSGRTGHFQEIPRFVIAGILNTGSTYLIYRLIMLATPYATAYTLAYLAGIGISYLLNTYYVFRTSPSKRAAAQYPFVYVIQYLVGLGALHLLVRYAGVDARIAPLLTLLVTVPMSYVLSRRVIRGKSSPG